MEPKPKHANMTHALAIAGLAAACVAWYLVQRWAGLLDDAGGGPHEGPDCDGCEIEEACPAAPFHERSPRALRRRRAVNR